MQVLRKSKAFNLRVDAEFLRRRIGDGRYGVSKWIRYCQHMLSMGYELFLKETHNTNSKYITVKGGNDNFFVVRFSDHKPNMRREAEGHCDFFVGVTNFTVTTWEQAVVATLAHFNK